MSHCIKPLLKWATGSAEELPPRIRADTRGLRPVPRGPAGRPPGSARFRRTSAKNNKKIFIVQGNVVKFPNKNCNRLLELIRYCWRSLISRPLPTEI